MENKAKFNPKVSFYRNVFGRVKTDVDILKILAAIKKGRWAKQIEQIRNAQSESIRRQLKQDLPAFTTSGVFTIRKTNGLVLHSGLIQVDIDHINEYQRLAWLKEDICNLPWTYAAFFSPSGKGLKVIFRIPAKPNEHLAHFKAIERLFLDMFNVKIDPATKDITRLCFVSYDSDLFVNTDAKIFNFSLSLQQPVRMQKKTA